MKAIIIDDEQRARVSLSLLLKEYCPEMTILDECQNLAEGIKSIKKHQPNIVFLDIEMPKNSGLEILDYFNDEEINFGIIFTTAYNEYAIQAFKLSAVDYLLKPINPQELVDAVNLFKKKQSHLENLISLKKKLDEKSTSKIAIPVSGKVFILDIDEILYIKAEGSYTQVFKKDNTPILVSRNLKSFEDLLQINSQIKRVHKSYIINMDEVVSISKTDGGFVEMSNGVQIPISGESYQDILETYQLLKR